MLSKNPNKKIKRAKEKEQRVLVQFNTGTRSHKSKKAYDRKASKAEVRKMF